MTTAAASGTNDATHRGVAEAMAEGVGDVYDDELFGDLMADDHQPAAHDRISRHGHDVNPQQASSAAASSTVDDGLARHEARANEESFRKMGYLEAYDEAKDERLQDGFEAGYREAIGRAEEVGGFLGQAVARRRIDGRKPDKATAAVGGSLKDSTARDNNRSTSSSPNVEKAKRVARKVREFLDEQVDHPDDLLARLADVEVELQRMQMNS